MVKQVKWNIDADEAFDSITNYLHEKVSPNSAFKFADKVYEKINFLMSFPEIGRLSLIDPKVR
jgi:plasmid stabilization system protein ParE